MWRHSRSAGSSDDVATRCLVLTHEVNRQLGAIDDALVVDISAEEVRRWGNPSR